VNSHLSSATRQCGKGISDGGQCCPHDGSQPFWIPYRDVFFEALSGAVDQQRVQQTVVQVRIDDGPPVDVRLYWVDPLNPFYRTFPQPRRRRVFGYISNVSTAEPRVTYLNGLTRAKLFSVFSVESQILRDACHFCQCLLVPRMQGDSFGECGPHAGATLLNYLYRDQRGPTWPS
jgi:hypothetical protein